MDIIETSVPFPLITREVQEDGRGKSRAGSAFLALSILTLTTAAVVASFTAWTGQWHYVVNWLVVAFMLTIGLGSLAQADTLRTTARLLAHARSPELLLSPDGVNGEFFPDAEYVGADPELWAVRTNWLRLRVARLRTPNVLPWTTLVLNVQEALSGDQAGHYIVGLLAKQRFDTDGCGLVPSVLGPFLITKTRSGGGVRGIVPRARLVDLMKMAQGLGADLWIGRSLLSAAGRSAAASLPYGNRLLRTPVRGYSEVSVPMPQASSREEIVSWLLSPS